jgi:DNA-binding MarR family transcriptional regulator
MNTEQIYEYLERIANLLRTDTRKIGAGRGLQPVQLEALHYLGSCNRYSDTPAASADFLGLTKGTVSQTLGVLERLGFVEKRPDSKDRRVVHLHLTERGREVLDESFPPATLKGAMERIGDAERELLASGLQRLLRAMQEANRLRSFGVCKTCRHHRLQDDGSRRCGLTGETLTDDDSGKICREHEPPGEATSGATPARKP